MIGSCSMCMCNAIMALVSTTDAMPGIPDMPLMPGIAPLIGFPDVPAVAVDAACPMAAWSMDVGMARAPSGFIDMIGIAVLSRVGMPAIAPMAIAPCAPVPDP